MPASSRSSTPNRETQTRHRHKDRSGKTRVQEQGPQAARGMDPVQTRIYLKWRKRADKRVARGQQEMFTLLEDSFRRFFPSRREVERPQHSSEGAEASKRSPARTPQEPSKRRKPGDPEPYRGAALRRSNQREPREVPSSSSSPKPKRSRGGGKSSPKARRD